VLLEVFEETDLVTPDHHHEPHMPPAG
jgi:hypothetical protein